MEYLSIPHYRGLKEKYDELVHSDGIFFTTDTHEIIANTATYGETIDTWSIADGVLTLTMTSGKTLEITFDEATEDAKGFLSAEDKKKLNVLEENFEKKVDKVDGKSLVSDTEISKLADLPNKANLDSAIADAKKAGTDAQSNLNTHEANTSNPHKVTKVQVELGNVTNDAQVKRSEMGVANGVATLDADGKVPSGQLPAYVDDVLEFDSKEKFPTIGETGKIYVSTDTNLTYRWSGTQYVEISASLALGETSSTAYAGDKGKDVADKLTNVRNTLLSHIKDTDTFSTTAEKVSLNYECYVGDQYGGEATSHSVNLPVASETQAGIVTAADKTIINNVATDIDAAKKEIIGKNTDGKDAETVYGAKAYAKDYADTLVNSLDVADSISAGSFVTKVSEENGKISVSKAAIASSDKTVTIKANETTGALDLAANIDGDTIVKSTNGVLSVASSALTQYVGSNAVKVSAADASNNKTISLAINGNDKVLSQDANGLLTTLAISFDSTSRKVQLKGKNSTLVSEFDATAFVKDGILNDAKAFLATGTSQAVTFTGGSYTFTGLTAGNHYIGFEFATKGGEKTEYTYDVLDATDIIDVYVAGNGLALSDHTFSVKKATDSETFLSVDANGVKVSGVQNAINTAAAKATTVVQKTTSDAHINVTSSTASDGHMVYTVASVDTASALGLTDEISRAKSVEDTIEASVGLAADGSHVKTSGNYTNAATTIAGEIAALDTQVKALADAKVSVAASTDTESAKYLEVTPNATNTVYTVKTKGVDSAIKVETDRAKAAEAVIDAYVGKSDIPEGKTVMGVIVENEEITANSIKSLATASGLLGSDDEIAYTAPTTSGEFSATTSIMDMLNHIDSVWNTIDCGSY